MARYEHLPIYKASYVLSRETYRVQRKLPKDLKHSLGAMVFESTLRCLRGIVVANGARTKIKILHEVALEAEVIATQLRMLHDLQGISKGELQTLSERLADMTRQLQAWSSWERREMAQASKENVGVNMAKNIPAPKS